MFSNQTYEVIRQRILDNIDIHIDKREGSFTSNIISPIAEELTKAYIDMGDILSLGFIEDTFDTFLDKRVSEFGIYRKEGIKSVGEVKVEGQDGAIIINGTLIKANDLYFTVLNDIKLPDDNILYVEANEVGYKYNLLKNTEFELVEKNDKITKLVNEVDFVNGVDVESDEDLRKRFINTVNNPSASGNKNHYKEWALECDGIGEAKVYPLWNGNGTVKVLVIGNDNLPVEDEILESCRLHIEKNRPIGATVTVETPQLLNLDFNIRLKINENYSLSESKEQIIIALNECVKFVEDKIVYSKFFSAIGELDCVDDILEFTINEGIENILIDDYHICIINSIEVSGVL